MSKYGYLENKEKSNAQTVFFNLYNFISKTCIPVLFSLIFVIVFILFNQLLVYALNFVLLNISSYSIQFVGKK